MSQTPANSFDLHIGQAQLSFIQIGSGHNIIVCAHGYKQDKSQFRLLFEAVPEEVCVLAFDQPMHGETKWGNVQERYDIDFLTRLWAALLQKYPQATSWSLVGFSMGGKTAMLMHMCAPLPIQKLMLIAPGGVYVTPLNRFFSYHWSGRKLFQFLLKHPEKVMAVFDRLFEKGYIRKFQHRFIRAIFVNTENRTYMKDFLAVYSKFDFDIADYGRYSQRTTTQLSLIWGREDEVVEVNQTQIFMKYAPQTHLHIVAGKHTLIEDMPEQMRKLVYPFLWGKRED